jgi:hypothetical protein
MALYHFQIRRGDKTSSAGQEMDLPNDRAAWDEGASVCRDFGRDIFEGLTADSEWKLEVINSNGKMLFRFRFLAETLP